MLGNSLTLTLGGSGGTAKVLPLINQDGYSAEYFLNESLSTWRAIVRHSRDTVKLGSQPYDRHVVTFTHTVKPTETLLNGSISVCTYTLRVDPNGDRTAIVALSDGMSFYFDKSGDIADRLLNWES